MLYEDLSYLSCDVYDILLKLQICLNIVIKLLYVIFLVKYICLEL